MSKRGPDEDEGAEPKAKKVKAGGEVVWEHFHSGKWIPYKNVDSALLEKHFQEHDLVFETIQMSFNVGTRYQFNLDPESASQKNTDTGTTAKVRRVAGWACEVCTYLNHVQYPKCKICRTSRTPHAAPPLMESEAPPKAKKPKLPSFFSASAPLTTMPSCFNSSDMLSSSSSSSSYSSPSSYSSSSSFTATTKISMLSLQEDLVDHIFSFLDNTARFACLRISRGALTLLQSRPKAWGPVLKVNRHFSAATWSWLCKLGFREIEVLPEFGTTEVLMGLARCHKLQTLRVEKCTKVTDEVIAALAKRCPLRNLSLSKCDITDNALAVLKDCVLETLDLTECLALTDAGLFQLKHHVRLHVVQLNWNKNVSSKGLSYLRKLPLQLLNLSMCPLITDEGLAELVDCPLQRLSLNGCNISNVGLSHLKNQRRLNVLGVEGCTKLTDAGMEHLRNLDRLEMLLLSHCTKLTDAGIRTISHLPLRHLRISRNPLLTDACLAHLSPSIQSLEVNWCPLITDKGLQNIGEHMFNLRALDVSGCKLITNKGLGHVAELPLRSLKHKECPLISKRNW